MDFKALKQKALAKTGVMGEKVAFDYDDLKEYVSVRVEFADPDEVFEVLVAKGVTSVTMMKRLKQADVDAWDDVSLQIKLELRGLTGSVNSSGNHYLTELFRGIEAQPVCDDGPAAPVAFKKLLEAAGLQDLPRWIKPSAQLTVDMVKKERVTKTFPFLPVDKAVKTLDELLLEISRRMVFHIAKKDVTATEVIAYVGVICQVHVKNGFAVTLKYDQMLRNRLAEDASSGDIEAIGGHLSTIDRECLEEALEESKAKKSTTGEQQTCRFFFF